MSNLPQQPDPADYTRPVTFRTYEIEQGGTFDVPLDAKLLGLIDRDSGESIAVFVQEGQSQFQQDIAEWQRHIGAIEREARDAGFDGNTLDELDEFVGGGGEANDDAVDRILQFVESEDEDE